MLLLHWDQCIGIVYHGDIVADILVGKICIGLLDERAVCCQGIGRRLRLWRIQHVDAGGARNGLAVSDGHAHGTAGFCQFHGGGL